MKLNETLFDRIRVKPEADRARIPEGPRCEHPGCGEAGEYRAPKGRQREGEYWRFCLEHVREYNSSYNYFAGMPLEAVESYQKSAITGHRPTWSMGVNAWRAAGPGQTNRWAEGEHAGKRTADPFEFFRGTGFGPRPGAAEPESDTSRPTVRAAERTAFATLDLEIDATREEIKARYKALVKRFHPDANGGDRGTEDRFRSIVQAYALLKSAGFAS
jgi:hypothetical protein